MSQTKPRRFEDGRAERLQRALDLVIADAVRYDASIECWRVKSLRTGQEYRVSYLRHTCTCPDFARHGSSSYDCKHLLAVEMSLNPPALTVRCVLEACCPDAEIVGTGWTVADALQRSPAPHLDRHCAVTARAEGCIYLAIPGCRARRVAIRSAY